jgi:enolase
LFAAMKAKAVTLGKRLVELERGLNAAFATRNIDEKGLRVLLNQIGTVRAKLRYVHLATHLKTPAVLSTRQIDDYNRLRGYGG